MKGLVISAIGTSLALITTLAMQTPAALAGDGVVALQTADPSCGDDSGDIYVSCGNGTVTDNRTGLVWLKNANCLGKATATDGLVDWFTAAAFVAGLADLSGTLSSHDCGLSDNSSAGEWRLPTAGEWEAMVADAKALNCEPTITDDTGVGCFSDCAALTRTCSFTGVVNSNYFSATTDTDEPTWVLSTLLFDGSRSTGPRTGTNYVWPVRGGQ